VANAVKAINSDRAEVVIMDGKERKRMKAGKSEIAEALLDTVGERLGRGKK
jgi:hypothetical protein